MFLCNGGKGYKGEFVYIRDDREEGVGVEYFSLCEVRVFGLQGNDPFPRGIIVRIERVKCESIIKSKDALRNTASAALEFIETSSVVTFKCSTTNRIKIYPFNIHFLYFAPCFNLTAMVVCRGRIEFVKIFQFPEDFLSIECCLNTRQTTFWSGRPNTLLAIFLVK